MVTLKEIADDLGVSVSTVSLVVNGKAAGRVNADLSARIRTASEELGYRPNWLARGLKTRRTNTIGFISDTVASTPFASAMLYGAQQVSHAHDNLLLVVDSGDDPEAEPAAIKALLQRDVDALILASDYHRVRDLPVRPRNVPVIFLDCRPADPSDSYPSILPDEVQGAMIATQHLLESGHTDIGYLGVTDQRYIARTLRFQGFQEALRGAGLDPLAARVASAPSPATADGRAAAHSLLSAEHRPTAVFCFSDQLAMAVIQVASGLGLRVPEDVSVVGFDNQRFVADSTLPGLTTVQLPHRDMGASAVDLALAQVGGELSSATVHLTPCPLVVRDSVARPGR